MCEFCPNLDEVRKKKCLFKIQKVVHVYLLYNISKIRVTGLQKKVNFKALDIVSNIWQYIYRDLQNLTC